eukprot:m.53750 g.53750  ORF g.53750 m.53750 type:complete len:907 (-) comp7683_c1_seq1:416-3136(-)
MSSFNVRKKMKMRMRGDDVFEDKTRFERATKLYPQEKDFHFPFDPYDIQQELMKQLFNCFEQGGLGIFQSPTGTGKSLSILCGALTWLDADEKQLLSDIESNKAFIPSRTSLVLSQSSSTSASTNTSTSISSPSSSQCSKSSPSTLSSTTPSLSSSSPSPLQHRSSSSQKKVPSWVTSTNKKIEHTKVKQLFDKQKNIVDRVEQKLEDVRKGYAVSSSNEGGSKNGGRHRHQTVAYDIGGKQTSIVHTISTASLRKSIDDDADLLLRDVEDYESDTDEEEEEEQELTTRKIFICSRTHSQLSQLVGELKGAGAKWKGYATTRLTTLASRKHLCTNPQVNKLGSLQAINEMCLELKKTKESTDDEGAKRKKKASCPYYSKSNTSNIKNFILASPHDIEDVVTECEKKQSCAYYSSRSAVPLAQLVLVPYNLLLHKPTRESVGLDLEGNVVVIDEAHNLMDTIAALHSVVLSLSNISIAFHALSTYFEKFKERLSESNKISVAKLVELLKKWNEYFQSVQKNSQFTVSTEAFLSKFNTSRSALSELLIYCRKSDISKKILGYVRKYLEGGEGSHISPLNVVESFMQVLTNGYEDGCIVISKSHELIAFKYILLNPAVYFEEILLKARSVAVIGGTMGSSELVRQELLTPKTEPILKKMLEFRCDHIVSKENVYAAYVSPTALRFSFTRDNKMNQKTNEENMLYVGELVNKLCDVVTGGLVIFFCSYDYERQVFSFWEQRGIVTNIESKCKVVREAQNKRVDSCLSEYSSIIKQNGKAMLTAVVGGKLSEGINFKDKLGRCVVIVGMPYPNRAGPELAAKLAYLKKRKTQGKPISEHTYYKSLCMNAVNQSIGRAIRHKDDYAAILFVDQRYSTDSVQRDIPTWIKGGDKLRELNDADLKAFFKRKCQK